MKTARPIPADVSSGRRAQPLRQTRANPPRTSGASSRSFGARDASGGGLSIDDELQTEIFPAITHFADAITALPRELVRHFTLLKEVDAKIFAPEEALGKLIDTALNYPLPERPQHQEAVANAGTISILGSGSASLNGSIVNGQNNSLPSNGDIIDLQDRANTALAPENIPRRQLFRSCAYTMQDMLLSLDEKNHVISTATEALDKQLARLNECFSYVEGEVSEEAKYGSTRHWAYPENRVSKPNERSRRQEANVNHLTNAANLAGAEEAAARSDARKQALLAKKGRNNQHESDFDDHKNDKRSHGNTKKGRPADAAVGLGITNGGAAGGPPSKRRKVEKGASGATGMERSLSGVYGAGGTAAKGKISSPRETPVPDPSKKKAKTVASTANGQQKKKTAVTNSIAMSPSMASSPIHGTFAESKTGGRVSPPPTNGFRPTTTRARQNSTQSVIENSRQRPSSSASNKPNGNGPAPDLTGIIGATGRPTADIKTSMKELAVSTKGEHLIEDNDSGESGMKSAFIVGSRKEGTLKHEDSESNGDNLQNTQTAAQLAVTTTKSGRASKPSTPAMPSFPEPARSRSNRAALDLAPTNKRSHKKGAGQAAQLIAAQAADEDSRSSIMGDEDDVEIDADEPTYCYCNGVSYGEMVACDADGCEKEWFHLECVGLKVAPKGNAKWYCDDCKEKMKNSKRFNGR